MCYLETQFEDHSIHLVHREKKKWVLSNVLKEIKSPLIMTWESKCFLPLFQCCTGSQSLFSLSSQTEESVLQISHHVCSILIYAGGVLINDEFLLFDLKQF